ncbi:MAG: LamG domain-containing protein [Oscillospiraceae bacterium]
MNETLTNNSYYSLSIPTDGYASIQDLGIKLDGSNEFCIEAWVLLNGMGIDISIVKRNEVFTFGISHGKLYLMIGQDIIFSDGETHVTSRKWHHVAVYYDLFTLKFYVNGIPDGNTSIQLTTQDKGTTYLLGENLDGRIRSLRIYNRAIDLDTLLSEMYTPTDITELCTDFDFSSNPPVNHKNPNQEIELNGRARITEAVPALYLEGTAYAQPTLCKNINPGGKQIDPYTLQIFFYISKNQFHQTIFVNGSHDSDAGIALYLRYSSEEKSYRLCCLRGTDTKQENKLFSQTLIHSNTWNNVAITYDGQTTILYINGEKDVTDEKASPILTRMNEGNVLIGGMLESGKPTGTNTFQGYIQRIDIWDKALTADEISNYSKDVPKSASDGLVECFDFTNEPFRGYKTDVPIAVCDGAQFKELITDAPQNVKEYNPVQTSINVNYKLPIQARENFDISFHHSQIHERFNMEAVGVNELFAVLEKDVENEDIELLRRRGQLMSSRKDFLLGVTHHQEGMDYILIAHYYSESIPICRCSVVDIDDCLLRIIELIYLLIGGAITAIFGIKTRLTPEAINFIRMYILSIPAINVLIAKGTEMKATDVYQLGHILYTEGVLKALVRTMVSLGFWLLMRLLSKLVLTFLGVGWVDTIAALVATAITFTIKIVDYITHCLPLPAIAIEEIWFDHPDGINDSHSLHIRKNKGLQIQYPEWTSLRSEPVAYALTQINNRTIKAKFVIYMMPKYMGLQHREIPLETLPYNMFSSFLEHQEMLLLMSFFQQLTI